ncbi:MogA/MoaB family molybdenum cofactor biosynthesis protein [Limnoraphis robusta]|uniref:MogA/MoaB family molybdenum cofactor biosynthesis protein n=1 Tax=Limnoraphis robusta TaxID=1118279 RepID=UPI002B1EE96D|nr:molybdenum cofactor biosynthesis protein B [Limnoraphis robusta]MEA5497356.1 molybdenum cofactor biosynthesis protein B [Limnoraphis robusta BA-68 BA1]
MNPPLPHPDASDVPVNCAVITVSDTRTPETDKSGQLIQSLLKKAGYQIQDYLILPDEPQEIRSKVLGFCQRRDLDALMINGGTGIAPRDTTYDALERIFEKILPGFGEIFRSLSYAEIGSRAIASRAVAGICQGTLVFSLPGSTNAVKLAMEKLILPELTHLVTQLKA